MFQKIHFDLELDPLKLLGGVEVFRSLEDKKKGPKFYVHAKRDPLKAEVRKLWHANTYSLGRLMSPIERLAVKRDIFCLSSLYYTALTSADDLDVWSHSRRRR